MFALKAIELISQNIKTACDDGTNIDIREKMQIGATMAMIAAMNSKLGYATPWPCPFADFITCPMARPSA